MDICDPCFLKIKFLGRKETMSEDMLYLVNELTPLHTKIKYDKDSKYYKTALTSSNYQMDEVVKTLDKDLIRRFVWKYRMDYLAFGYNPYKTIDLFN